MSDGINHNIESDSIHIDDEQISYADLHVVVCDLYKEYLGKLKELIVASERVKDIDLELRELQDENFEQDKWEEFETLFSIDVVNRVSKVDPKNQSFSFVDTTYVRKALANASNRDFSSFNEALFKKVSKIEKAIMFESNFKGGNCNSPISIDALIKLDCELEILNYDEFGECLKILKEYFESEKRNVEEEINLKADNISKLEAEKMLLNESFAYLAIKVIQAKDILAPYHLAYQTYNEELFRTSNSHLLLNEKANLKYKLPNVSGLGLENELGKKSYGNHFDVFIKDGSNEMFYAHFHEVLSIQMFLDLANSISDIHIYKGSDKKITKFRGQTGPCFVIPKNSVLTCLKLDSQLVNMQL